MFVANILTVHKIAYFTNKGLPGNLYILLLVTRLDTYYMWGTVSTCVKFSSKINIFIYLNRSSVYMVQIYKSTEGIE